MQPSKHGCPYEKRSGSHISSDAKNYMLREIVNPVTHVTMINYLRNGRDLTFHCKSKDDSVDVHVTTLMGPLNSIFGGTFEFDTILL